jgi:hypothetical protein
MEQAGKPGARKAMAAAANQVMMAVHSAGAQDNGK